MKRLPPITQMDTIKSLRKKMPPACGIIMDKRTKAKRKRVKMRFPYEPYMTSSQHNTL